MRLQSIVPAAAVLAVALALPAAAAAQPVILSAVPSETNRTLTITGLNFGTTPTVNLNLTDLVVLTSTPLQILAQLPALPPGTYTLIVAQGAQVGLGQVTLGAAAGGLSASPADAATPQQGFASAPLTMTASLRDSAGAETLRTFTWQASPVANNSPDPGARLELLSATNGGAPVATGLGVGENGRLQFAAGQTFPGVVAGISAGAGLEHTGNPDDVVLAVRPGGVSGTMIAGGAIQGVDVMNGVLTTGKMAFDPATQLELQSHVHDTRFYGKSAWNARFHPRFTRLGYSVRILDSSPWPIFWPTYSIGTFTKSLPDSKIVLMWNGTVRSYSNWHAGVNNYCGFQLHIDEQAASNGSGTAYAHMEDHETPMAVVATFEGLAAGQHTVGISIAGDDQFITHGVAGCEINPAAIPETIIVKEVGR